MTRSQRISMTCNDMILEIPEVFLFYNINPAFYSFGYWRNVKHFRLTFVLVFFLLMFASGTWVFNLIFKQTLLITAPMTSDQIVFLTSFFKQLDNQISLPTQHNVRDDVICDVLILFMIFIYDENAEFCTFTHFINVYEKKSCVVASERT